LRTFVYEDENGDPLEDIEYDDENLPPELEPVEDCIMLTRPDAWTGKVDSLKLKKKR